MHVLQEFDQIGNTWRGLTEPRRTEPGLWQNPLLFHKHLCYCCSFRRRDQKYSQIMAFWNHGGCRVILDQPKIKTTWLINGHFKPLWNQFACVFGVIIYLEDSSRTEVSIFWLMFGDAASIDQHDIPSSCSRADPYHDAAAPVLHTWDGFLRPASFSTVSPIITATRQFISSLSPRTAKH